VVDPTVTSDSSGASVIKVGDGQMVIETDGKTHRTDKEDRTLSAASSRASTARSRRSAGNHDDHDHDHDHDHGKDHEMTFAMTRVADI
jgi:ABC-type Zn2+ transport system substrate-binding protein/surface adhesin